MKPIKKRILVVDDEAHMTSLLRLVFQKMDCEVKVSNIPTLAVAVAERFRPDLILLDVSMPEMDGGELAARFMAHESLGMVPILFLTGSVTREEVAASGGRIGGLPFLAKPINQPELLGWMTENLN